MARAYDASAFKKLRQPTLDEFKKIARTIDLDQEQHRYLITTVNAGLEKCREYHARRTNRPDADELHDCAADLDRLLINLETRIERSQKAINVLGLPENVGVIGRLLSFEAVAKAVKGSQIDCDWTEALVTFQGPTPFGLLDVERALVERKQIVDARNRAGLLLYIVRTMREQFTQWLDAELPDPGGVAPQAFRRIMFFDLACHASLILGARRNGRPAIRRTGGALFTKLCDHVLDACGIEGAESRNSAIKNFLKNPRVWAIVSHYNVLER